MTPMKCLVVTESPDKPALLEPITAHYVEHTSFTLTHGDFRLKSPPFTIVKFRKHLLHLEVLIRFGDKEQWCRAGDSITLTGSMYLEGRV